MQNILEDALHYMNVPPRKDQLAREYKYGETPTVTVPNLVGATVQDLYEDLNMNFMLAKSGTGNTVISQAPKPGSRVERGLPFGSIWAKTPREPSTNIKASSDSGARDDDADI